MPDPQAARRARRLVALRVLLNDSIEELAKPRTWKGVAY